MSYANDLLIDTGMIDMPGSAPPVSDTLKPLYTETETKDAGNDRFVLRRWQDICAGVFVVLLVIATITLASIFAHRVGIFDKDNEGRSEGLILLLIVVLIGFIAFVTALLFYVPMYFIPRYYIIFVNLICIAGSYAAAGAVFKILSWRGALCISIPLSIGATVHFVWFLYAWSRIPFAASVLKASVKFVYQFLPGTLLVSFGMFAALVLHTFVFIMLLCYILLHFSGSLQNLTKHGGWLCIVALLLYWYWMIQIIRNIVFVTVSGIVATKYFLTSTNIPTFVTAKCLCRALTTSFGSICFGSLLVAMIHAFHRLCHCLLDQCSSAGCIVSCWIDMMDRIAMYFNNYAFTYVALYGASFIESSKKAWTLISHSPFATFFNDSLISNTTSATSLIIVVAVNVCAYYVIELELFIIFPILLSGCVTVTTLRTIDICATTLYVCVTEVPKPLEIIEPELHQKMCKVETVEDIAMEIIG